MKKRPGKAHLYKNNIFIRAENSSVTQWFMQCRHCRFESQWRRISILFKNEKESKKENRMRLRKYDETIRIFFNFWQDGFRHLAPTHVHQSELSGFKTFPISLDISGFERNETITCRLSQKLILVSLH